MGGVIGDGRIGGAVVRAGWVAVDGGRRQEAARPREATVLSGREPDVRRAAVEAAAALKGGDDGRSGGECIGLHLRGVLTLGVAVRVAADLDERPRFASLQR